MYEKRKIENEQKIKELEEEFEKLIKQRENLSDKKKIEAINSKINTLKFKAGDADIEIDECIEIIKDSQDIIKHNTKYINKKLSKK